MAETRKLAAILAADIVGYSRLAGSDEDRTLARLRALWSDLIGPTIAVHRGRVVKRTGDGSIIEFRSVVDAVRCAIEVQNGMVERNAGLPPERRIEFRVGIHLGDVVEESDGDLMGDGVNIAARLEGICPANGISLSHGSGLERNSGRDGNKSWFWSVYLARLCRRENKAMGAKPWVQLADGVVLDVRVTPRSARDAIEGVEYRADGRAVLRARVRAPPFEAEANDALRRLIARELRIAPRQVEIAAGASARLKRLRIVCDARILDAMLGRLTA